MRRNVPKVLVVVTDGRSQDEVKKSAEKLQHSGACDVVEGFRVLNVAELFQIRRLMVAFAVCVLPPQATVCSWSGWPTWTCQS